MSFTLPHVCIERIMMKPRYIAKTIKTIGSRIHIVKPLGPRIHNLSHCARNHSWQAPHQTDRLNQPHVTPVQCFFFALVAHPASTFLFWSCTACLAKPNKNVKSNESAIEQNMLLKNGNLCKRKNSRIHYAIEKYDLRLILQNPAAIEK